MRNAKYGVWAVAVLALLSQVPLTGGAQSADVKADYDRATSLNQRLNNKLFDIAETPIWIDGSQKFWYRKSVKGGNQFVLVDAVAAAKAPAFDHARLATALSAASGGTYTAVTLPFSTFAFVRSGICWCGTRRTAAVGIPSRRRS